MQEWQGRSLHTPTTTPMVRHRLLESYFVMPKSPAGSQTQSQPLWRGPRRALVLFSQLPRCSKMRHLSEAHVYVHDSCNMATRHQDTTLANPVCFGDGLDHFVMQRGKCDWLSCPNSRSLAQSDALPGPLHPTYALVRLGDMRSRTTQHPNTHTHTHQSTHTHTPLAAEGTATCKHC
jgi:hypothetical protein